MATLQKKKKPKNLDGLKIAHGTHVKEADFQLPDGRDYYIDPKHNYQDHIGYDPSGKPVTYRDVPLYNREGGSLGITRNNEGMIRKEYHRMTNTMHEAYHMSREDYLKFKDKYGLE
tara:strand:+ start:177 stop:524 length:348 start_codon:yes stop_codon:yes gene_type:complete